MSISPAHPPNLYTIAYYMLKTPGASTKLLYSVINFLKPGASTKLLYGVLYAKKPSASTKFLYSVLFIEKLYTDFFN